jgi:3-oxoacyl-[acyl-carrier protein] reductase
MFSLPLRKPKVQAQVTTTSPVISLRNKTMLVTGASSGIGRAIAVAAARAGALVAITYRRNRRGAEETVQAIAAAGGKVHIFPLDLTEPGALEQLVSQLSEQFDGLDTWVNNAGADILTGEGKLLTRRQKLDAVLDVDLRGTVLASWAAVDYFRARQRSGSIINMSWDHVLTGMAGENPVIYSAAKGGIHAFSKSLAREVAPLIRVNVIAPGFIDTAFGDEASADWRAHVERVTPLGRWGTPEDVAQAAVYLASDAAAFVTGQALLVNGGVVM